MVECTITPDIKIVISSTVFCSLYSFINVLNLQVLSDDNITTILLLARAVTSDIPAILGLERFAGLCVSWRHRQ